MRDGEERSETVKRRRERAHRRTDTSGWLSSFPHLLLLHLLLLLLPLSPDSRNAVLR